MKNILIATICLLGFSFASKNVAAHCEVPCGIYDDSVRIKLIYEHILTIEKAMTNINDISKDAKPNYNQLVRWVTNKEEHATKIQEIVSQYFLHQRVKPVSKTDGHSYEHYVQQLEILHNISVLAMKAKQGTDSKIIGELRNYVAQFEKAYFTHSH